MSICDLCPNTANAEISLHPCTPRLTGGGMKTIDGPAWTVCSVCLNHAIANCYCCGVPAVQQLSTWSIPECACDDDKKFFCGHPRLAVLQDNRKFLGVCLRYVNHSEDKSYEHWVLASRPFRWSKAPSDCCEETEENVRFSCKFCPPVGAHGHMFCKKCCELLPVRKSERKKTVQEQK